MPWRALASVRVRFMLRGLLHDERVRSRHNFENRGVRERYERLAVDVQQPAGLDLHDGRSGHCGVGTVGDGDDVAESDGGVFHRVTFLPTNIYALLAEGQGGLVQKWQSCRYAWW